MCGICGRYNFNLTHNVEISTIKSMCNVMIHRGPDDEGAYVDRNFGFGMRRLSIIDLNTGNQPIFNEDNTIGVVFNGEIYNYIELRRELQSKGHSFKTNTDTETLIHAYEEYGELFVEKLNGEFAFAIYDKIKKNLLLYRDRVGIKPLYYYIDKEKLIFASEIKSVLQNKDITRHIDLNAIDLFLSFGFIPAPHSIFESIKKLKPAHYVKLSPNGNIEIMQYWDFSFNIDTNQNENHLIEEFLVLFTDAVRIRMQCDVPYGAFLSGGIDSSLIVALMSKISHDKVNTFSLGYANDNYFNENRYAELVSEIHDTNHNSYHVDSRIMHDNLDMFIKHFDEPFGDYSAFPVYIISKYARNDVKVVLSGDGGDELFSGYKRYYAELIANQIKSIPKSVRSVFFKNILCKASSFLPASRKRNHLDFAIKKLEMLDMPDIMGYFLSSTHNYFSCFEKDLLYKDPSQFDHNNYPYAFFESSWGKNMENDYLGERQYLDIKTKLPDDMLVKVDRMSMAASLEVRVPFLDHRVIEFASKLPSNMRMNLWKMKRFLKHSSTNYLPKKIINRHKHGFSSPIDDWFRQGLYDVAYDLFNNSSSLYNIINREYINNLLISHINRDQNYGNKLFLLLVLHLWFEKNDRST